MVEQKSMLNVRVKTKPITKLLHFIRISVFYVGGGSLRIVAYIKNFDSAQFQGGMLKVVTKYGFGNLEEEIQAKVEAIDAKKEVKVDFEGHDIQGVLAQGHALFFANIVDKANNPIHLCNEKGESLQKQR